MPTFASTLHGFFLVDVLDGVSGDPLVLCPVRKFLFYDGCCCCLFELDFGECVDEVMSPALVQLFTPLGDDVLWKTMLACGIEFLCKTMNYELNYF